MNPSIAINPGVRCAEMASFTILHALQYLMRSVATQAKDDSDVLWAEADFIHVGMRKNAEDSCFQLTLRENLDGAGKVKCYLVSIKEIEP